MICQHHQVGLTLTQRRDFQGDRGQAEIQVFPEMSLCNLTLEITVSGSDDANVDLFGASGPDSVEVS